MTASEQAAYNNDKMIKRKRKRKTFNEHYPNKRTDYMKNCIFWIEEYNEGRTTQDRVLKCLNQLKIYIQEVQAELLTPSPEKTK